MAATLQAPATAPAVGWREEPLVFDCQHDALVGVLCRPSAGTPSTGVVIIVGGPQYRAGSHRQFVHLARQLAAQGHAVLRFDVRGMGDSGGDSRPFTTLDDDISAAVDVLLARQQGLRRVVLWGLCDGASAALLYWRRRRDSRVAAMCLLNPWLRSEQGQARTQVRHYYVQRLLEGGFWRKLLQGGVGWRALSELTANLQRMLGRGAPALAADRAHDAENFRDGMAVAWRRFPGPLMLVLSGRDYTAKEFMDGVQREAAWAGALQRSGLHRFDLPTADHTFSVQTDRQACEAAIADWLRSLRVETVPPGVGT